MITEILNNCTVDNNVVKLPPTQLDRETYLGVKKSLEKIGGKWTGGKVQGFKFDFDPTDLLTDLQGGKDRNIKKEFQFFETPESLAKRIVELAEIQQGNYVLEPSAGRGAILKQITLDRKICFFEIFEQHRNYLSDNPNFLCIGSDFLQADETFKYDRIIANPPFSKNQDIDHIRKMYAVLKPKGVLVSVASKHWQTSSNRKETDFRNWLSEIGAEIFEVEAGAFKESGTNISTVIIRIRK